MNKEIKERIETINKGKVPDGYIRTKAGLMPCDWIKSKPLTTNMIFENISDKNHGNEYPVLSATQEKGIVLRSEIEKDINFNKENTNSYKLVCKGDYVISLRSFQGGIEYSNIDGLVSPAYTVIRPIIPISDGYYKEYFKTNDFIDRLNSAIYGIRDGKQIGYKDFAELALHNPPLEEQEKIAEILSRCDTVIEECEKQVEEYKSLKKTCLGKMFPKKGSNIPEIRFPGFTDAWEQRKLGDVGSVSMCRRIFKEQTSESGEIPFYKIGTFGGQADAYLSEELFEEYKLKYPYPKIGDVLISASGSIGRTVEFTGENAYFQDSNIVWLNHDERIDNTFLKCFYNVVKWSGLEGSTIKRLYNDNILKTEISIPSIDEQRKIGAYFEKLDHLITLHQRKVEAYTQMKKALTQLLLTGIVRVNKQKEILP